MIVLKSRGYISEEDIIKKGKLYAKQAQAGAVIIPADMDLEHVSEETVIRVAAAEDPDCEENPNSEEDPLQQ